jgi:hypothetical protein
MLIGKKCGAAMIKIVHATVHGKTIELDQEVGVPDGQRVEVPVQIVSTTQPPRLWGDGLRRCAGELAGIRRLAEDMDQILHERKSARFPQVGSI